MAQRKSTARRPRTTPVVGDEVRVPAEVHNEFARYGCLPSAQGAREPVDGLIVSIREISSGEPVKVAAGDPRRYVFDLLHSQTFDPRVSSKSNSQGVVAGRIQDSPAFAQVQRTLRERARKNPPIRAYDMLSQPPFSDLLDGWRLMRFCSAHVNVLASAERG